MTTPFPFVASQVLTAQQLNDIQNLPISDKTASYTLIAGDETKRTIMNSASATTITVDNSIFTVGDVIQVANKGAGTCTITAGAGVTINTSGSLALAQYGGGYLLALSASTFTFFNLGGGSAYGTATGGSSSSITVGGINYTLLTFTSTGTLTVTKAGFFDYCAVGGGGGSVYRGSPFSGGGGGAGQVGIGQIYLDTNQTITIGAGGTAFQIGGFTQGGNTTIGASSPFNPAGIGNISNSHNGNSGDAYIGGGAGKHDGQTFSAITTSTLIGFKGGNSGANTNGGGGGGQSGNGGNGSGTTGGTGGTGFDRSAFIGGSASFIAVGGGGGGSVTGGSAATGGVAGSSTGTGNNGGANTGCGGGGIHSTYVAGGSGGSGICYIRFKV